MRLDWDLLGLCFMDQHSSSCDWLWVVGLQASWRMANRPWHKTFERDIHSRQQPGLGTSEMLLGAGGKTGVSTAFTACTVRRACQSLYRIIES